MAESFLKQSYAEQLAAKLREAIQSGAWPPGSKVPSIRKLAGEYGVSPNTVQAALRKLEEAGLLLRKRAGRACVNPALSSEDIATCEAPAERPSRRFPHVGLVGPTWQRAGSKRGGDWLVRIFREVEATLMESGNYLVSRIGSTEQDPERYRARLNEQMEQFDPPLAGVVVLTGPRGQRHVVVEQFEQMGVPWVAINQPSHETAHNYVSADNLAAGRAVGRCFLLEGIERVVVLAPDLSNSISQTQKVTGLIESFLHHGRPISGITHVHCKDAAERFGYQALSDYLAGHEPPQAVFTTGDNLAAGAMRACRERGLSVPEQVSVVGSTGLDISQFTTPPMTVVPQPMEAMGRAAGEMLIRMIQTGERRLPARHIAGRLVLRGSLTVSEPTRRTLLDEGMLQEADEEHLEEYIHEEQLV